MFNVKKRPIGIFYVFFIKNTPKIHFYIYLKLGLNKNIDFHIKL